MAEIGFMIICEDVYDNNRRLAIDNPYSKICPYSIPGEFSFTLAMSLFNLVPGNYVLSIECHSPSEKVWSMEGDINFNKELPYGYSTNINVPFKNFLLKEEGTYRFVATISGVDTYTKELRIPVFSKQGGKKSE